MKDFENSRLTISVVVCTKNRADLLADVLQTLCVQTLPTVCYEVIVVDNDSKDHTRMITEHYCRDYDNVRYCIELQHGLSNARNRGWQEANGLYVAYVDDDCKVPTQWLAVANEIIEQFAPAAFGGPYYAFYKTPKSYWWKDCYGTFEQSKSSCSLSQREYLRGGNIFISRSVLKDMCGFDTTLGMNDHKIGYGEESELQRRIRETMPDALIYYDTKLYVHHLIRPEKMTLLWALNSYFVGGRCSYHVFNGNNKLTRLSQFKLLLQALLTLLRFSVDLLIGVLRRDRKRYPYLQNYLYENTVKHVSTLGLIYEKYIHY
jgi:glycosyltransferase involved in cell wall biosynthesis